MATKSTGAARLDVRPRPGRPAPATAAEPPRHTVPLRSDREEAPATATTGEGRRVPWLRILISIVGTVVLATVVGVPFPGMLATALIAALGAFWIGRRTFRRVRRSHPGSPVVTLVASVAVAAAAFAALFFVVLYVWMILWLETTPM